MKKLLLLLIIFSSFNALSQNDEYKIYSYTQFFKLIEKEQDTLFELNDAVIQFDDKTDERFRFIVNPVTDSVYKPYRQIIIDKSIKLNNVHFRSIPRKSASKHEYLGAICNIYFKRNVTINNTVAFRIIKCKVDGVFSSQSSQVCDLNLNKLRPLVGSPYIFISRSEFSDFNLSKSCPDEAQTLLIETEIYKNKFNSKFSQIGFNLRLYNSSSLHFRENEIINTKGSTFIRSSSLLIIDFSNNNFDTKFVSFNILRVERGLTFSDNTFSSFVHFYIDKLDNQDYLEYSQIKNHFIPLRSFFFYFKNDEAFSGRRFQEMNRKEQSQINQKYLDSVRYYNKSVFTRDLAVKGLYYDHYKNKYETETANEVYIEMKDMETIRLSVLYSQNPSFKTYFKWKVNQFLKLFSDYGTEPSKAIVVSLYVILFFALIYLFFPNSWDSHGKKRLMHRFDFFQKYLRRKEGMHAIYLEDKQHEISSYNDFKQNLENAKLELPSFFISWSKPLYNASMLSFKLMISFLKTTDVLKGKWQDLSPQQKRWKNVQIGLLLIIGLFYDLFIKILNALMLSINTFTTLGFGEIPIKGLPRYLAIIQGFIGWFMLTIFSVSLISQLLN